MSDLALARSFLEHARQHLTQADSAATACWRELDDDQRVKLVRTLGLVADGIAATVRRLDAALERIDKLQPKERPPPTAA